MFFFRHQALARLLSAVGYTHSRNFSLETAYNSLRLHFEISRLINGIPATIDISWILISKDCIKSVLDS